ncbi:hypothetical protein QO004_005322 [Rhizobium mesoamericanum]|nr:hypothetical protein [Rhizobium mesoamericanum]
MGNRVGVELPARLSLYQEKVPKLVGLGAKRRKPRVPRGCFLYSQTVLYLVM